jgi:bifunctional UDP-N-acetylglucosamine pyrophosphorylase/glucosamine-1-phosphate N-acetyltransferase
MKLGIVILAAGQGTRMRSSMPKVLHRLAGLPLLQHVVNAARQLAPERCVVVYGHGGERVRSALADQPLVWVEQAQQRGTGHAVMQAMPALADTERVLVLYGDVPLIRPETLHTLIDVVAAEPLGLLSLELEDPGGYGRVLRDPAGRVLRIVEQKDASPEELEVRECNTGILCADTARLGAWLARIGDDNAQGEYYLTDIVGLAVADGAEVAAVVARDPREVTGVNDRVQLAALERDLQRVRAEQLMRAGATLLDPARFDLRGTLRAGQDLVIDVNVVLEGAVSLGDGVQIGANTVIRNSEIGPGVQIRENCVIEDARIGADSRIGPFARIRPDTDLAEQVHIGNFVEIKKSRVGFGSKINHLSYVGDTSVGRGVNIGAGTITCNYDGANKHRTLIGDGAFIGSDTQLVAPVEVGAGATIGAGSTITRDAPADKLTLSRARQMSVDAWQRPVKKSRSKD